MNFIKRLLRRWLRMPTDDDNRALFAAMEKFLIWAEEVRNEQRAAMRDHHADMWRRTPQWENNYHEEHVRREEEDFDDKWGPIREANLLLDAYEKKQKERTN